MAYTLDIEWDFDHEPIVDALGTQSISFILGYDLVLNTTYFMVVRLTTNRDGLYDLRFGIEERDNETPEWQCGTDYHIEISKKCIPRQYRSQVLDMIILSLEVLVANCTPVKITMQSYHRDLPDKAMAKYKKICENMEKWGYGLALDERDGTSGVHYWLFKEREDSN
jgi:hypothetical protein